MPKTKDFYHRIEVIDECFRQKGKKWSVEELLACVNQKLQDRFDENISKRTIQYALDYLINEKGAPLERIKKGARVYYYYSDANYSIKNLPLTDEEIVLLKDAVEVIKQIGNTSIAQEFASIIGKLENTIDQNPLSDRMIIQFERHTSASGIEYLDDLFTAIKEKIVLKICYQPFGKEPYEQIVHPYLLKQYRNRWFLIARNHTHNTVCNMALDRIQGIKATKQDFIENDMFDPHTYFNKLIGVTFPEGEVVTDIVIAVKPNQVPYIKTKPIHFTQEIEGPFKDGSIVVKLRLINNYELRSVLLSYGSDIEVLQPEKLRAQMKKVFQSGSSVYR